MALNKTFKNQDGSISNGYYRVSQVHTQYEKTKDVPMDLSATFVVEVYDYDTGEFVNDSRQLSVEKEKEKEKGARRSAELHTVWRPEGRGVYGLTLPEMEPVQNLIIKAYEHLKTLPEFSEATDC